MKTWARSVMRITAAAVVIAATIATSSCAGTQMQASDPSRNAAAKAAPIAAAESVPNSATAFMTCGMDTGDLNGDGRPEVVSANHIYSGFAQLTNASTKDSVAFTLNPAVGSSMPEASAGVVVADFNRDSRNDVASANHPGSVMVATNTGVVDGNATFGNERFISLTAIRKGQPGVTDFGAAGVEGGISAGDFDGDGAVDIVSANLGARSVTILRNATDKGAQTTTFGQPQYVSTSAFSLAPQVADLNKDGKPDIVTANLGKWSSLRQRYTESGSVSVLLNTSNEPGAISFAPAANYDVDGSIAKVALADLDHDGNIDIAAANWDMKKLQLLAGSGGGKFASSWRSVDMPFRPGFVDLGDFNGDGKLDFVSVPLEPHTRFAGAVTINTSTPGSIMTGSTDSRQLPQGSEFKHSFVTSSVTADVNGDGYPEVFSGAARYRLKHVVPTYRSFGQFIRGPFGINVPTRFLPQYSKVVEVFGSPVAQAPNGASDEASVIAPPAGGFGHAHH